MAGRAESIVVVISPDDFRPVQYITVESRDLIFAVANAMTNPQIAELTHRSEQGVKNSLRAIYERLGIATRAECSPRVMLAWWWWHGGSSTPLRHPTTDTDNHV